jgi:excisionase family DNA binding protein
MPESEIEPEIPDGYLTVSAACSLLGVSRPTLFRLVQAGKLASYELPIGRNRIRFKKADLLPLMRPVYREVVPKGAPTTVRTRKK